MAGLYNIAAVLVLGFHLAWILWVILGAFWTSGRPWLTSFHVASLLWGIVVEVGPWPCPLTLAGQYFQSLAGKAPVQGSFLLHFLERIVYPDLSVVLLTVIGVVVCCINLFVYAMRLWRYWREYRTQEA